MCCTMVRTESNHHKLVRNYPMILAPSGAQSFKEVRTTPNSWEIILWSLLPLELSGSRRFEPHQSHVKLLCRSGSLCCAKVWTGLEENSVSLQALPTELQVFLITFMGRWPMPIAGIGAISHFPLIWSHDPHHICSMLPVLPCCFLCLFRIQKMNQTNEPAVFLVAVVLMQLWSLSSGFLNVTCLFCKHTVRNMVSG